MNWAIERGTIPIPRSSKLNHVVENIQVYDFKLSEEEVSQIDALDKQERICNKFQFFGAFDFFC